MTVEFNGNKSRRGIVIARRNDEAILQISLVASALRLLRASQ